MILSKNKYLKDNKVRAVLFVGLLVILYFAAGENIFGMGPGDIDRPITDYGNWYLYEDSTGTPITSGMTINAEDGLKVTFILDSDTYKPDTLDCKLYKSGVVWEFIELGEGGWQTSAYIWHFNLDATSEGTFTYFIVFFGEDGSYFVSGETYTFQIYNGQGATYLDPEIIETPADGFFDLMESPSVVEWKYIAYGTSTITVTVNNVLDFEGAPSLYGVEMTHIHDVDTSVDGTYNIVFTVTPEDLNNQIVSDSVEVIIELASATYDDPAITAGPVDQEFLIDSTIVLEWEYTFELSAVLTLYIDDVEIETEDYAGHATEQLYTYSFTPEDETDYTVKFELVPDNPGYVTVTDEVVITGTITVPTITTTTTDEPPLPISPIFILGGLGAASIVLVIFVLKRGKGGGGVTY